MNLASSCSVLFHSLDLCHWSHCSHCPAAPDSPAAACMCSWVEIILTAHACSPCGLYCISPLGWFSPFSPQHCGLHGCREWAGGLAGGLPLHAWPGRVHQQAGRLWGLPRPCFTPCGSWCECIVWLFGYGPLVGIPHSTLLPSNCSQLPPPCLFLSWCNLRGFCVCSEVYFQKCGREEWTGGQGHEGGPLVFPVFALVVLFH